MKIAVFYCTIFIAIVVSIEFFFLLILLHSPTLPPMEFPTKCNGQEMFLNSTSSDSNNFRNCPIDMEIDSGGGRVMLCYISDGGDQQKFALYATATYTQHSYIGSMNVLQKLFQMLNSCYDVENSCSGCAAAAAAKQDLKKCPYPMPSPYPFFEICFTGQPYTKQTIYGLVLFKNIILECKYMNILYENVKLLVVNM